MANNNRPVDDDKMNSHFQKLQAQYKKTIDSDGEAVKDITHNAPTSGTNPTGPMKGHLMGWTQMLESMDEIQDGINNIDANEDVSAAPVAPVSNPVDEDSLLNELNQIFTPILVMQGFEGGIADKINEAFSEASVLTERNIISFDNKSRMAQLIAVCALLIARQKDTEKYQMYKKAATIKNQMKLEIQKDHYDDAQALAQKFLVKVATTNNSSIARDAANELLPETQH